MYASQTLESGQPCPPTARRIHVRVGGDLYIIPAGTTAEAGEFWGVVSAGDVITIEHDGLGTENTAECTVIF